jgi:hypothetical protein
MTSLLKPDTLWLITVNILLGLAIIVCGVVIALNFAQELRDRRRRRKDIARIPKDYLSGLKDLGVTLPDGGEKIDEMNEDRS